MKEKRVICYYADKCLLTKDGKLCVHNKPHIKYDRCNHTMCPFIIGEIKGCVPLYMKRKRGN